MNDQVSGYLRTIARAVADRRQPVGRNVAPRPGDVFLTSYPKSGNTWTRFLVANLVFGDRSTDFTNIEQRIPDIYKSTSSRLAAVASPRYIKSHEYFDPRYPRIVYIVRDVRSVMLSYYHHLARREEADVGTLNTREFARAFLAGKIDKYGSWADSVECWLATRGDQPDRFLLLRYEDLLSDGLSELRRLATFLGIEVTDEGLHDVLQASSFERMRELETSAGDRWAPNHKLSQGSFVRAGKRDEWKEELDEDVVAHLTETYWPTLSRLGYV